MSFFHTISYNTEGLYKDKGSKFIALTFSVSSEEEIKDRLHAVRKEYYDARHHCYGWILGLDHQKMRANDDGEPSHSAGDPILGQIRSHGFTNVLVIVVRYFGGTKLGVGGLINAYKEAANDALLKAGRKQIYEKKRVKFSFEYPQMSIVERMIGDFEIEVVERVFRESCEIYGIIRKDQIKLFVDSTNSIHNISVSVE